MKINVRIDSNMRKTSTLAPPIIIDLPDDENTLEDLLIKLSGMYADLILIKNGKVDESLYRFLLNGESYTSFPEGLRKKITEGDSVLVDVYIDALAGG
jgi:hypothetical protein